ncbi:MAG TPA: flagellar basal body P-ring protein FlgI [Phycisphaerae bacterium]|jgi:flagellar P-ring protein precursor FlgI|nr:flagellar basal body P-ring protein FlgI [Phycisphaerae bacterium]HOB75276.1 flagellar basal body P-ring protein FlgI [Phycisphaerae bacterium]HOJ55048.1 flagellar basal body P-ring protein FlgI [Phycisphaerae bacterium]HOL27789.1 flagellar basal body P-ring protein FlgI [Phycisphaerae bacterium]HPP21998.1 flagellar basal body P-ring protein FlgI [Phycisphaerae bacterium]
MVLALMAGPAQAVKIGDITHLQGTRTNKLVGMGLVVGLAGTGDGNKHAPSIRALAQLHARFANPIGALEDFRNVKNVAIVTVEATLPEHGAREGERVDVFVSAEAAKSLAGGRLLLTPLVSPNADDPRVMAMASGPLQIEDSARPTVARIAQGATLEQDWVHNYVALGRELAVFRNGGANRAAAWVQPDAAYVTLVLDEPHAEWAVAYTIAQSINEEGAIADETGIEAAPQIAMAFDPRTVIVRLPEAERANPAPFLARIENLSLFMPATEARVVVKRSTGGIVITGDAEIAPAVVTYKGLTITTVVPEPEPTPENPRIIEQDFIPLDPQKKGGAKLSDLVDALNQLRVSAPDKINIIEQLYRTGKLHATLVVEN